MLHGDDERRTCTGNQRRNEDLGEAQDEIPLARWQKGRREGVLLMLNLYRPAAEPRMVAAMSIEGRAPLAQGGERGEGGVLNGEGGETDGGALGFNWSERLVEMPCPQPARRIGQGRPRRIYEHAGMPCAARRAGRRATPTGEVLHRRKREERARGAAMPPWGASIGGAQAGRTRGCGGI